MELSWHDGATAFAHAWLVWLLGGLAVAVLVAGAVARRRRVPTHPTYVAHATRLRSLPRYRALVLRRTVLAALATAFALVTCAGGAILAGRLQQTRTMDQDERTRDIMLCLDASGSMSEVDAQVVAEFETIVEGLQGERIGLTIWDSTAITVFPLTDDYAFVRDELDRAEKAFEEQDYKYYNGLYRDYGTSLIGDGLASCVQRFDRSEEERGRAIVLASDNVPYGKPVYTFQEAGEYATEHGVVVHGIAAPGTDEVAFASEEFQDVVTGTGGTYHLLDDGESAGAVAAAINTLEARKIDKPPLVQVLDRPDLGRLVTGAGAGLLGLVWLVEAGFALARRRAGGRR